jgi:hypothetical protein
MFDYNDPDQREPIEFLAGKLRDKVAKYERHATAKQAAETGKDANANAGLSLKAMQALSASDATATAFEDFQKSIANAITTMANAITPGDEHVWANMFATLSEAADAAKKTATDWAPTFKAKTVTFTDGDLISDEALKELREDCDKHFRKTIEIVDQLAGRVEDGDASVKPLIEQILGVTTTTRVRDGKTQYQLDITRFRTRNPENISATGGSKHFHLVLMVDGEQVPGNSFQAQTMAAFGKSGNDFLALMSEAALTEDSSCEGKWKYDTDYTLGNSIAQVQKRDGDWPAASN